MIMCQDQEEEKQRWRRELMASQEQVRAFVTGGSDSHSFRCWSHVAGTHWTLGIAGPGQTASSVWSRILQVNRSRIEARTWSSR